MCACNVGQRHWKELGYEERTGEEEEWVVKWKKERREGREKR